MRALDRALAMLALGRDGKFLSFQNDELDALSSLAAENGWLRGALEDTAWRAKQDTEDEWRSVLEDRLKTIAENARAALSLPAPEGMAGGDEVVP